MEQVGCGADDPRPGQRTAPGSLVHASPPLNCTQWYKYNGTCECAKHSESFAVCTCFLLPRSPVSQAARIDGGQTRQREELPMAKQVIAVLGGTGGQGGGVVEALLGLGQFTVRVASRNPAGDAAKALARRGVEVVKADLLDAASLRLPFEGAYGAFVVTNFWDPAQMPRETEIGVAAMKEARAAGIQHIIWSTLPDAEKLSGGRLKLPHFTGKARVDAAVEAARFPRYTFVQAPFYFQNFLGLLAPGSLPNGGRGWAVPMDPAARVIQAGDVKDVGRTVAAALAAGDQLRNGSYLP